MPDTDDETKHNLSILKALNKAIREGPWDFNLFFKATGKKLKDLRDRFVKDVHLEEYLEEGVAAKSKAQASNLREVFLSLYQADGMALDKWASLLAYAARHSVNRPIYANEDDVKKALRNAVNKKNEAYISVMVSPDAINKPDPNNIPKDRHGSDLLSVHEGAIRPEAIQRFVHVSGQYHYKDGKLTWQSAVDFLL